MEDLNTENLQEYKWYTKKKQKPKENMIFKR